jgi:hypothetical protein
MVSSSIKQSRSPITGDVPMMVIVHTDSGYDGDPAHPGTGVVTSIVCPLPW